MKSTLKAAGLILAAVVLGLMTVQGTYALWNQAVPSNAGTVQAADFSVRVNQVEMTTPIPFTGLGQLTRGSAGYTQLEIVNNVNVTADSPLRLQPTLTGLVPTDNFGGKLSIKTAQVTPGTICSRVAETSYAAGVPSLPPLLKGSPQTICFKVELGADTHAIHLGNEINIPVTLTVAQTAPAAK